MRILKGIALDKKNGHRKKLVHMFMGKAVKKGSFYTRTMDDVYENILFYGDKLRGIRKIINCSEQFMLAEMDSAPLTVRDLGTPFTFTVLKL